MAEGDTPSLLYAAINTALTGDNVVVAAVPGKSIQLTKVVDVVGGITNLTIKDGAATSLSGPMPLVANGSITLPYDSKPWFSTSLGNALIFNSSGTTIQQSGVIGYRLSPSP